jgi:hypothetical protein
VRHAPVTQEVLLFDIRLADCIKSLFIDN